MSQRSRKGGISKERSAGRSGILGTWFVHVDGRIATLNETLFSEVRIPVGCSIFLGRWMDVPLFPEIARRVAAWVGKTWDHDGSYPRGQPEMMDNPGDRHPLGPIEEYIPTYAHAMAYLGSFPAKDPSKAPRTKGPYRCSDSAQEAQILFTYIHIYVHKSIDSELQHAHTTSANHNLALL